MAGTKRKLVSPGYGKQKRIKVSPVVTTTTQYYKKAAGATSIAKLYKDVAKLKQADTLLMIGFGLGEEIMTFVIFC